MNRKLWVGVLVLGVGLLATAMPASAQGLGPFQFHSLTPCRIVDTRNAAPVVGGYGPIMQSGTERQFPVQGNCGVPVGATAVTVNVTACAPTNQGRLSVYPVGVVAPTVSTINFPAGTTCLANGAIVPLAATGASCAAYTPSTCDFAVTPYVVSNGQVHMVLDVTGYFQ